MTAGALCIDAGAAWNACEFAVAVYFGRKKADIRERNGIIVFFQTTLHNVTPAFAQLYRLALGLAKGIKRQQRLFFFGFGVSNRRFVAFEGIFKIFCGNFNISFSAGRTSAAKN